MAIAALQHEPVSPERFGAEKNTCPIEQPLDCRSPMVSPEGTQDVRTQDTAPDSSGIPEE